MSFIDDLWSSAKNFYQIIEEKQQKENNKLYIPCIRCNNDIYTALKEEHYECADIISAHDPICCPKAIRYIIEHDNVFFAKRCFDLDPKRIINEGAISIFKYLISENKCLFSLNDLFNCTNKALIDIFVALYKNKKYTYNKSNSKEIEIKIPYHIFLDNIISMNEVLNNKEIVHYICGLRNNKYIKQRLFEEINGIRCIENREIIEICSKLGKYNDFMPLIETIYPSSSNLIVACANNNLLVIYTLLRSANENNIPMDININITHSMCKILSEGNSYDVLDMLLAYGATVYPDENGLLPAHSDMDRFNNPFEIRGLGKILDLMYENNFKLDNSIITYIARTENDYWSRDVLEKMLGYGYNVTEGILVNCIKYRSVKTLMVISEFYPIKVKQMINKLNLKVSDDSLDTFKFNNMVDTLKTLLHYI